MISDEEKIERVIQALERLGISHRLARHAPAHTMEECAAIARRLGALIPKNLLLCPRNESAFTLLVMRPENRFCSSWVSRRLESPRLGFASEEWLMEKLMAAPGAAGPLGLLLTRERDLTLALDERLKEAEELAFHPSTNIASLAIPKRDFEKKLLPALNVAVRWISVEEI